MDIKKLSIFLVALAAGAGLFFFLRQRSAVKPERTFAIIKPEVIAAGKAPEILGMIRDHGFTIVAQRETTLDKATAEQFYGVHKDKAFFPDLVTYITSGPVIVLVLEKENAVQAWRDLMGATNPEKAVEGTIRKRFGTDIQRNAVHGSDSVENAQKEIKQFFPEL